MKAFLVIQTAFAGDLILTLPLAQEIRRLFPGCGVDVLCIPETAALLSNHPAISTAITYDKRGGTDSVVAVARRLRRKRYDVVVSPHRSFRSALLAFASGAPVRISFDRSSGSALYTHTVPYAARMHEIRRVISLLTPLRPDVDYDCAPRLYPADEDRGTAARLLARLPPGCGQICIAPGSVWATKRYTREGFARVARALLDEYCVVLMGGSSDRPICDEIASGLPAERVLNTAGEVSYLTSASLIGHSRLLISNDSAPVHMASAMGTPVVEIFGATSPEFGFTPFNVPYEVVQMENLPCKPCRIHGGHSCPIRTFDCMNALSHDLIIGAARRLLDSTV